MVFELHAFDPDRGRHDGDAKALRQVDLALDPRAVAQRCDGNPAALEVRSQISDIARTFDAAARESGHGRRHFTADQKDLHIGESIAHLVVSFEVDGYPYTDEFDAMELGYASPVGHPVPAV